MAAAEAKAAQEACAADSPPPAAAGPVEARKGGSGDGKDGGQDGGEAEADATASVHAAEDACSEDKRQAGCSVGGAPAAHGALRQNSLLSWEPSVLPTLEVDMAAAANGTAAWVQQQAAGDPGAADRGCAGRQSDSVRAGRSSKSRPSSASPQLQQPPRPASPRGAAPAAAAAAPAAEAAPSGAAAPEAESKLAYAPPHERPEGDSDPDVGGGSVHGVPVPSNAGSTDGSSSGQGSGGKDACVPAPEMAEARLTADLQDVLCAEARQLPPWHAAGLLLMCATVLLTSLFSKRQACGGWQFWAIQAAAVPVLLGLSVAARRDVLSKARVKKAAQVRQRAAGLGPGVSWSCVLLHSVFAGAQPALASLLGCTRHSTAVQQRGTCLKHEPPTTTFLSSAAPPGGLGGGDAMDPVQHTALPRYLNAGGRRRGEGPPTTAAAAGAAFQGARAVLRRMAGAVLAPPHDGLPPGSMLCHVTRMSLNPCYRAGRLWAWRRHRLHSTHGAHLTPPTPSKAALFGAPLLCGSPRCGA